MSRRLVIVALAGAAVLWLAACSSSPVQLRLAEPPAPTGSIAKAPANALRLTFSPAIDIRPAYQQTSVGHVGGRDVVADNLTVWIDRALQSLHGQRFVVCHERNGAAWHVTPRLRQFYTSSVAVSKNANVVLELEIQPPAGPAFVRVYRGRINAMNWWNTSSEIEGSVVNALGDCMDRIAHDLDTLAQPDSPSVSVSVITPG